MKMIEISKQVWEILQDRAVPLVDMPDDVLRRLLGIEIKSLNTSQNKRVAINPGISCSAMMISFLPKSAREISLIL